MIFTDDTNLEMAMAWRFLTETGTSLFLTGKAGTGKTTFLRRLRNAHPKRMVVLAPTGVAALNAEGQTIHSFFQLPLTPFVPGFQHQNQKLYQVGKEKKRIIRTLDLLVIDEVSMVRCDLLDAIDAELRRFRDRSKPFGGVQLLMIGDLQQLAPVAKEDEWALLSPHYSTPYFFSSKALQQVSYATIELQTVYRQQEQDFVELLGRIRDNNVDDSVIAKLNSRYVPNFVPPPHEQWIKLTTHNHMAQNYNATRLLALDTEAQTFTARISGNFPEYSYPTDPQLQLKVGAQVMFVKNDPAGRFFNGKIGRVMSIEGEHVRVYSPGDANAIDVEPMEWQNMKYRLDEQSKEIAETVDGTFTQIPLRLAWAITIHKSQGLTFDHAMIDINDSFAHGQAYVALSRCRTLGGMVLARPVDSHSIITDSTVGDFTRGQVERSVVNGDELDRLRFAYFAALLEELFSFGQLMRDFDYYIHVVDEHLGTQYLDFLRSLFAIREQMNAEVVRVALSFRNQYTRLLSSLQNADFANDAHLQERIRSAAIYFSGKLREHLDEVVGSTINIENKQVLKQYQHAHGALAESYHIKLACLEFSVLKGFSVSNYLKTKAMGLLDIDEPKKKRASKKIARTAAADGQKGKKEKTDTKRLSLQLFNQGKSIAEVAAERSLTTKTIESHLAHFVGSGELDIRRLVPEKHEQMIRTIFARLSGSYALSDVKAELPAFITYAEIKAVQSLIEGKG